MGIVIGLPSLWGVTGLGVLGTWAGFFCIYASMAGVPDKRRDAIKYQECQMFRLMVFAKASI